MGENSIQFIFHCEQDKYKQKRLNLDLLDRGKSERSTGVFLFGFG